MLRLWLLLILLAVSSQLAHANTPQQQSELPLPERWLEHTEHDIAPFWMMPDAMGVPLGNFPSFRCNDGSTWSQGNDCNELYARWIGPQNRQYIRMQSRQVFTYGALYHLTGDPEAFRAMRAGSQWLLKHVFSQGSTGVSEYFVDGKPGAAPEQTTAQDQAYALLGLAMDYYLTRDPELLGVLLEHKRFIFEQYLDPHSGMLRWLPQASSNRQELVAQLDQLNAYMLLLLPILPEPYQSEWQVSVRQLVDVMLEHYYFADEERFYGTIDSEAGKDHHARHGDFGHTAKAFWMTYLAGELLGDDDYMAIAEQGLLSVFERAYQQKWSFTFWSGHADGDGSAWWEFAELDQAAATLLATHPELADKLSHTYRHWLTHMVDKQHGGILPMTFSRNAPKVHLWKNGYHATEHALVAYITTARYYRQPFRLFFAALSTQDSAQPAAALPREQLNAYLFAGHPHKLESQLKLGGGYTRVAAWFSQ